jgi:DMSO/TMAO reductase YedYZ molybdopterin-dependent catalytic subunit
MTRRDMTRRELLRSGLAATGLLAIGVPEWATPAMAQGETLVPFTDVPPNFNANASPTAAFRQYDTRRITPESFFTPRDEFFAIGHNGVPELDPGAYGLQVTGLVDNPMQLSLADIQTRQPVDVPVGYECSGNRGPANGLSSNGLWRGTRLADLLRDAGVQDAAREVVFFGADRAESEVAFRNDTFTLDQQFARSMSLENAMREEPIVAYALNGDALTPTQGFPARLIMPGWYGVANVKWLTGIHVQEDRFVGHFQARWYRTVAGESIGGDVKYTENEVTKLQLKSVIARVTAVGSNHRVLGFVLNDGTPLRSVEVRVDDGPWQSAVLDPQNTQYSWKLFTFTWNGATEGEHTLVSRATDVNGRVQATREDLASKQTFLEASEQFPRTLTIA